MANYQEPNQDRKEGAADGPPFVSLDKPDWLLSSLRECIAAKFRASQALIFQTQEIKSYLANVAGDEEPIENAGAIFGNDVEQAAVAYALYLRKDQSTASASLIGKLCKSSFAWAFIEEAFRERDELCEKVAATLKGLTAEEKDRVVQSIEINSPINITVIAENLAAIFSSGGLVRQLTERVEEAALARNASIKENFDRLDLQHYNFSLLVIAVAEQARTLGDGCFDFNTMKKLYSCVEGPGDRNDMVKKRVAMEICKTFPEFAHSIFIDRIYSAKLPDDMEEAITAYNDYYKQFIGGRVEQREFCNEMIKLLDKKPELDLRFVYLIVTALSEQSSVGEYGIKKLNQAMTAEINQGKPPRLLTAVCHLSAFHRDEGGSNNLISLLKKLLSSEYEKDNDIAAAFLKIKHSGEVIEHDDSSLGFPKDRNRMPPIGALSCIGYEHIFRWATSEDPVLRATTCKILRSALAAAKPKARKNLYENKVTSLIQSSDEFLKLAMDLAGWHPFESQGDA